MAITKRTWVRVAREGLKVPLAPDAGPEYFDFTNRRQFKAVLPTNYIARRLLDHSLIEATADEVKQLEAGTFRYPPLAEQYKPKPEPVKVKPQKP